jgi:hypothetical protein
VAPATSNSRVVRDISSNQVGLAISSSPAALAINPNRPGLGISRNRVNRSHNRGNRNRNLGNRSRGNRRPADSLEFQGSRGSPECPAGRRVAEEREEEVAHQAGR